MKFRSFVAAVGALCVGASVLAGEAQHTRIEIAVGDDTSDATSFVFDSEDAGFDLQSLQVGESRSITDQSGSTADIRRTEDGFEIDVNGKTIELPNMQGHDGMHGEHEIELMIDNADSDDVAVDQGRKIKKVKMIKSGDAGGVTIISGNEIGAETRARIAEALKASGQDGEVTFLDGSELHDGEDHGNGRREVRIIRKEVDVTN